MCIRDSSISAAGKGCWTVSCRRRMPLATTKIWPVRDSLRRVVDYAANPDKTEYSGLAQALHYAENDAKTTLQETAQLVSGCLLYTSRCV